MPDTMDRNRASIGNLAILTAAVLFVAACTGTPPAPAATTQPTTPPQVVHASADRNQAESLLYELVKSDKDVSGILIIKSANPSVRDLIKEIAQFCASVQKQLDQFAAADKSLHMDQTGLPPMELRARKGEASATSKDLLSHSGREFEARLLLTQVKAMEYARHVTEVATEFEKDPARQAVLKEWIKSFGQFRDRAFQGLAAK